MLGRLVGAGMLFLVTAGCGGATRSNPSGAAEPEPELTGGGTGTTTAGTTSSAGTISTGATDCDCLGASLVWWVDNDHPPGGRYGKGHLKGCATYEYTAGPADGPPELSCSSRLDTCDAQFGVAAINAALAHPDVLQARATAPVLFGEDLRPAGGQVDHIEIDGQLIELGAECQMDPACQIPKGISELDFLLGRMILEHGTCQ